MKRTIKLIDGVYRLCTGRVLTDSGDVYGYHDDGCSLCVEKRKHTVWAHWALTNNVTKTIDHYASTIL